MFTPSVVNPILIAIFIIFYHTNTKATFGSHKVLKKEKNVKENGFSYLVSLQKIRKKIKYN